MSPSTRLEDLKENKTMTTKTIAWLKPCSHFFLMLLLWSPQLQIRQMYISGTLSLWPTEGLQQQQQYRLTAIVPRHLCTCFTPTVGFLVEVVQLTWRYPPTAIYTGLSCPSSNPKTGMANVSGESRRRSENIQSPLQWMNMEGVRLCHFWV